MPVPDLNPARLETMTTSTRMLALLSLLQTRRFWPGGTLADRLGVSVRTLRRDVDRLRDLGYPVEARRGVDGGYQLAAGVALPPLTLDDDEAVALVVGLQTVAAGGVAGLAEASVGALAKVSQVMPARLRRRVDALQAMTVATGRPGGPAVDPAALSTVALACRDTERLRFAYTAVAGEQTEREVEPLRLVLLGRRWYLVAYDLARHDWRTFRLDRLARPAAAGVRFRPRQLPAEDAADFVRRSIRELPVAETVEVVVRAPADDVRRRLGNWATIEPLDGDSCRALLQADGLRWPVMALAGLEAEFSVIGPPELGRELAEVARRFVLATTPPDGRECRQPTAWGETDDRSE